MVTRKARVLVLAAVLAAPLLAGCASDTPYSAPAAQPYHTLRSPTVAPMGPASPWWWPLGESLWPGGNHGVYVR